MPSVSSKVEEVKREVVSNVPSLFGDDPRKKFRSFVEAIKYDPGDVSNSNQLALELINIKSTLSCLDTSPSALV